MNLKFFKNFFNFNRILLITSLLAIFLFLIFLFWWLGGSTIIDIKNNIQQKQISSASLTGLNCENYKKRPIAVMLASDPIARPLSGISQADVVVEMPVTPNGITRMMAIFQCEMPLEIGSIRSAREDFFPFIKNFKAIYIHWGGEKEALNQLNNGIFDNIDAMKYEGSIFYRKNTIPKPHNGFTTPILIEAKAKELGYFMEDSFEGYLKLKEKPDRNLSNIVDIVKINYENPYDIKWVYNDVENNYERIRGGEIEIDKNNGQTVKTSIVVLMHTSSIDLNRDYIKVNTLGEGKADFYQNGIVTNGTWKSSDNGIKFFDDKGEEMKFVIGKMWIEVVTN
jgi:hypothetical protein